ncbi:MAG: hypothetical protein PHR36_01145 [Patescibacteria group bacterium]|nr:hypothetical protein [Patescibacteria group bacterium]
MKVFLSAIFACVLALVFASCGPKPSVQPPVQATKTVSGEDVRGPSRVEAIVQGQGIGVSLPILEPAMKDSSLQMFVEFQIFVNADSAWSFFSVSDNRVDGNNHYPRVWGYVLVPSFFVDEGEWYTVRVWTETEGGTRLTISSDDPHARQDEAGEWGYEFVFNIRTGEHHPVPQK